MALRVLGPTGPTIPPDVLESWRGIPTAVISDEMNRFGAMEAGIAALGRDVSLVGEALTVRTMAADNLALHHAVALVWPGAVIVADAGGYGGAAVWGGILQRAAEARGVAGVIIDGAVRDIVELRRARAPVFARGATPAGPHKGWGGDIQWPVQCGGVAVAAGDLVCADDDGVVVVPRSALDGLAARCRDRMAMEARIEAAIDRGELTIDILDLRRSG